MEKGLSYFDLSENDYQFLLKDKKEGRVGNMMTVYGRAKGKTLSHICQYRYFFLYFRSIHVARIIAISSAAGFASQIPVTPRRAGRARRQMIIKTKDLVKASTADTIPLFRAVNIPLAKILNPINKSAVVQMRFPVTAS